MGHAYIDDEDSVIVASGHGSTHRAPWMQWESYDTGELHWYPGTLCERCSARQSESDVDLEFRSECRDRACHGDVVLDYDITSVYETFLGNLIAAVALAAAAQMERERR